MKQKLIAVISYISAILCVLCVHSVHSGAQEVFLYTQPFSAITLPRLCVRMWDLMPCWLEKSRQVPLKIKSGIEDNMTKK